MPCRGSLYGEGGKAPVQKGGTVWWRLFLRGGTLYRGEGSPCMVRSVLAGGGGCYYTAPYGQPKKQKTSHVFQMRAVTNIIMYAVRFAEFLIQNRHGNRLELLWGLKLIERVRNFLFLHLWMQSMSFVIYSWLMKTHMGSRFCFVISLTYFLWNDILLRQSSLLSEPIWAYWFSRYVHADVNLQWNKIFCILIVYPLEPLLSFRDAMMAKIRYCFVFSKVSNSSWFKLRN